MSITTAPSVVPPAKKGAWGRREAKIAFLFLSPALVYFSLFYVLPILADLVMTFFAGTGPLGVLHL